MVNRLCRFEVVWNVHFDAAPEFSSIICALLVIFKAVASRQLTKRQTVLAGDTHFCG